MLGFAVLIFTTSTTVRAENLVKSGDAEDVSMVKKWHKNLTLNTQDKVSGESSFQADAKSIWSKSPGFIEINPEKIYKLSGLFKSIGKNQGRCYLGLVMYDARKRFITRSQIIYQPNSQTKLVADAKVGDTVIKLADCSKWNTQRLTRTLVAFGAQKDFSDLPNTDLSPYVVKLEKQGDIYELTLKKALDKDYPAETAVRQHYHIGGYQYCAAVNKQVPNEWTKYSAVLKGISQKGPSDKQFWPGTKYVKVIIYLNHGVKDDQDCKTLFDDIVFEEVPDKE